MERSEKEQKMLEMSNKALRNQLGAERNFIKKILSYVFIFATIFIVLIAEKISDPLVKSLLAVFIIFALNISTTRILLLLSKR
jgi:hypothetical protein